MPSAARDRAPCAGPGRAPPAAPGAIGGTSARSRSWNRRRPVSASSASFSSMALPTPGSSGGVAAPVGLDHRGRRVGDGIGGAPIGLGLEDELALELDQVADLAEDGRQLAVRQARARRRPRCARPGSAAAWSRGGSAWLGHAGSVPEASPPRQRRRRHRGERERRLRRARGGGDIWSPVRTLPGGAQPAATVERTGRLIHDDPSGLAVRPCRVRRRLAAPARRRSRRWLRRRPRRWRPSGPSVGDAEGHCPGRHGGADAQGDIAGLVGRGPAEQDGELLPPKRAGVSAARTPEAMDWATARRTTSPTAWPKVSLRPLKWSMSIIRTPSASPARRPRESSSASSSKWPRLGSPVRASIRAPSSAACCATARWSAMVSSVAAVSRRSRLAVDQASSRRRDSTSAPISRSRVERSGDHSAQAEGGLEAVHEGGDGIFLDRHLCQKQVCRQSRHRQGHAGRCRHEHRLDVPFTGSLARDDDMVGPGGSLEGIDDGRHDGLRRGRPPEALEQPSDALFMRSGSRRDMPLGAAQEDSPSEVRPLLARTSQPAGEPGVKPIMVRPTSPSTTKPTITAARATTTPRGAL